VTRTGLATIAAAWGEAYGLVQEPGRHLQMAPLSFDVFVGDLVRALAFGGTLVICEREDLLDPRRLVHLVHTTAPDTAEFVPAVVRLLVDYVEAATTDLVPLRRILVGSDVWTTDDCRRLLAVVPRAARVICSYGTTETTVDSTWFEATTETVPREGIVPIGRPFPGVRVSVRDRRGRVLPRATPGELWIGGPTVGAGYPMSPEATSRRFVVEADVGGGTTRWFRTGDQASWSSSGDLVLHGRLDDQVKVRGVRVEPAEVEERLRQHPGVRDAAVVTTPTPSGDRDLVSFVVAADGTELDERELEAHVAAVMPAVAVPTRWRLVSCLPL